MASDSSKNSLFHATHESSRIMIQVHEGTSQTPVDALPSGPTSTLSSPLECALVPDIEHALVEDDPRTWSKNRKNVVLLIVTAAAMIAGMSASIQNPANSQIQQELHATANQIGMSLSFFILVQGNFPLFWSAISEIKGRKLAYLVSVALFTIGSIIVTVSKTIDLVIGMRVIQAAGSSAVICLGAATLADIFEPHQRGSMMGIYYTGPLLGPAIGAILGGGLTQAFGWRAIFGFLAIWGGLIFSAFLFLFKDTFRKERSSTYQGILQTRTQERISTQEKNTELERPISSSKKTLDCGTSGPQGDVEAQRVVDQPLTTEDVKLSIMDVNPFPPIMRILIHKNNVIILFASGLLFAFAFSIVYTCARTLSLRYDFNALITGLVLLSYAIGTVLGSILGGWWSDRTLTRLKAANGGVSYPEMRLESVKLATWWFPPSVVGYAWVCQQGVHVSAICIMLFLSGFFSVWIYASTLAYIVDANVGRSSIAVAVNSSFRGLFAFIAAEVAVPLQDAIGDGGLYTLWACLMLLAELMILLVLWKGKKWRDASIGAEKQKYRL